MIGSCVSAGEAIRPKRDGIPPVGPGAQDAVIPVEMGWQVDRTANKPKRIEVFPQGAHSDLFEHGAWKTVQAFLASLSG
jgi:hypothetical protein